MLVMPMTSKAQIQRPDSKLGSAASQQCIYQKPVGVH
jgi:hypothetical protein